MTTTSRSATLWDHNDSITAALRRLMSLLHISGSYPTGPPQVRTHPCSARPPSLLDPFTYRILGFGSSGLLAHGSCLTKVRLRLNGRFDSSFLQIPHWPLL